MKLLNILVGAIIVIALVMLVGGSLAGSAAEGFARGGGSVEARLLSPETYSSATAGDNGVAIAIQGDRNNVALAYSQAQPTPVPAQPDGRLAADDVRGLAGMVGGIFAAGVVCFVLYLLLFGTGGSKYR
jgi:hypothetical protein